MSLLKRLNIFADHIPEEIHNAAKIAANITMKVDAALKSNTAISIVEIIAVFFPEAETLREEIITLLDQATPSLKAVANDDKSYKGILQRLGSEITSLVHGNQHTISDYICAFEYVFGLGEAK
ncbi:MAG TPA: hypothetical protein VHA52_05640 [Candidatus Babeliaceae bacterium]|nr:hypothetical protein [Candidatus Babeliaceae bacterium]